MKTITKEEYVMEQYRQYVSQGEWDTFFEEAIIPIPEDRRRMLWDIMMESDLDDYKKLEDKVYAYGSRLGAKDHLGRLLFVRMVLILRKMHSVE